MQWFVEQLARYVVLSVQGIAIVIVAVGVVEMLSQVLKISLVRRPSQVELRDIWLNLARWLVAGLTLQLAADIVETTIAPTWHEIGRLGAIAATRTFLNYSLDRDMEMVRARQSEPVPSSGGL